MLKTQYQTVQSTHKEWSLFENQCTQFPRPSASSEKKDLECRYTDLMNRTNEKTMLTTWQVQWEVWLALDIGTVPTLSSRQASHLPILRACLELLLVCTALLYLPLQLHSLSLLLSLLDVPRAACLHLLCLNELAAWACVGVQVTWRVVLKLVLNQFLGTRFRNLSWQGCGE